MRQVEGIRISEWELGRKMCRGKQAVSLKVHHYRRLLRSDRNVQGNKRHTLSSTNTLPFFPVPPALPFRPLIFCAGCIRGCDEIATGDAGSGDCEIGELILVLILS